MRSALCRTILIVEDEPRVADVLAEMFRFQGHEVHTAGGGAAGLSKLDSAKHDVIVCDLKMPGMDGPEFYAEALRRDPDLRRRFVFITGASVAGKMEQFLQHTGAPYLRKPFELDDIEKMVAQLPV